MKLNQLLKHRIIVSLLILGAWSVQLAAEGQNVVDASSNSVAQRVTRNNFTQEKLENFKVVVLLPKTVGLSQKEIDSAVKKLQENIIKGFNSYAGVEAFADEALEKDIYDFLLNTSVVNYSNNTELSKALEKTEYALLPIIYKKSGLFTLSLAFIKLRTSERLAYTKTPVYSNIATLYGSLGAGDQAVASIAAGLKLIQTETPQFEVAVSKEIGKMTEQELKEEENSAKELISIADKAYKSKDYKTAFKNFKIAAQMNNAYAMRRLADMYYVGRGTTKNTTLAITWYKKSAARNDARAQTNLGILYETGNGVEQNLSVAAVWYEMASFSDPIAQNNLGVMYETGRGVVQDYEKAFNLYTKAAENGCVIANNNLGVMYETGKGVQMDYQKAFEAFNKAAQQDNAVVLCNLGIVYENGYGVKYSYEKAAEYYQKAADKGNSVAQNNLGVLYEYGRGVKSSSASAKTLYEKAKKQGDVNAENNLAILDGKDSKIAGYTRARSSYTNGMSCSINEINVDDVIIVKTDTGAADAK